MNDTIRYTSNHGRYVATADEVDSAIATYLPASPAGLRAIVAERTGIDAGKWADVTSVSAFLVILADIDN
jgi:ABC-type transport system involved in Fe-S cluster assembly fused permease/ATPase subunit